MTVRFLTENEFNKTKSLAEVCFGKSGDLDDYYADDVKNNRIAVLEDGGAVLSMVHLRRIIAVFDENEVPVWYIMYVCTLPEERRKGYMDCVMRFVLTALKKEGEAFTFLVPVNREIYKHLKFTYSWQFNEAERDLLYADDGLEDCFACLLNDEIFEKPVKLLPAATTDDFEFKRFDGEAAAEYFDYFYIRPNKSCDTIPLDCFIWSNIINSEYCILDNRCFLMRDSGNGMFVGCTPYCREEELVYYFKLQEKYYNRVLKIPFTAYLQDAEGVEYLKSKGALDGYEITQNSEIYDYIYNGNDLRTLAGRKFSKKRNHINKFLHEYADRWEYHTLSAEDKDVILDFLKKWDENKTVEGSGMNMGKDFDAVETLETDVKGTEKILNSKGVLKKIKAGGIFIDGKLCAFSIGGYNPKENMAVIEIEKAYPEIDGLYQMINKEFLVHEFPEAELINREDDVGMPGLRKAKMSYNPVMFGKKYTLTQKNFESD